MYLSTSIMGRTRYTNPWVPKGHTLVSRGERGFLQWESLASNLLLCYCFALPYFCLHLFIKNTKNSSFIVVIFYLSAF
jgi:hypothetical protein